MSLDQDIREAERKMKESPKDSNLIKKWMSLQMKTGAEIKIKWKIKQGDKYLGKDYYGSKFCWTARGKSWNSQGEAVEQLLEASTAPYNKVTPGFKVSNATVVSQSTYIVEEVAALDLEEQQHIVEYDKLQKQKRKLELEEEKVLKKLKEQREKLAKQEKKLVAEQKKLKKQVKKK